MPLSWRLVLGIAFVVVATAALGFLTTGRGVLGPFNDQVFDAYLDQAIYVADQVEQGVPPDRVGRRMGLEVHLRPAFRAGEGPPPRWLRGPKPVVKVLRDGREIRYRQGPRERVHIRTDRGWVVVRRDLDLERPRQNLGLALFGGVLLVVVVGGWVVRASLRPLNTALQAMGRVADGDLDHRIPEDGPPELQQVAQAFHRMTERLDALTRADRQLVAGVSHEIRTPLSRMGLRLELLEDEIGAHPRIDDLGADLAEINRLVGELVTLSRLQLGGFRLDPKPMSLSALVTEAQTLSDLDPSRTTVIGQGATVLVDPELATRAVANVLKNVRRHAPEGPVEILLDGPRVTVRDHGPGIDSEKLATIFDPFVRGDEAQSPTGLGLGLMIVKQVVDLHDGAVRLANHEDGGLIVTLDWPPA